MRGGLRSAEGAGATAGSPTGLGDPLLLCVMQVLLEPLGCHGPIAVSLIVTLILLTICHVTWRARGQTGPGQIKPCPLTTTKPSGQ